MLCGARGTAARRPPGGTGTASAAEELLHGRGVGLRDLGGAAHPAGHLGGLVLEVVAQAGLLAADLARAGHPEPLAGTGVRLVLRHESSVLCAVSWCSWWCWWSCRSCRSCRLASGSDVLVEVLRAPTRLAGPPRRGGGGG